MPHADSSLGPQSWGRYPRLAQRTAQIAWASDPLPAAPERLLPRGLGRSYGDSCLVENGALLTTHSLRRLLAWDPRTGVLRCEAGVTLGEITRWALPRGWMPAVLPGTRFVTVGGAIANDVHGKNHHRAGSFGRHVSRLELVRSTDGRIVCSPVEEPERFTATIGGLGLTGLITWAELQLVPAPSGWFEVETRSFQGLDDFATLAASSDASHAHTVAWVDVLARGRHSGRGMLFRGNPAAVPSPCPPPPRAVRVPFDAPEALLARPSMRAFNAVYARLPRSRRARRRSLWGFFHPLDAIEDWNRLYGRRGFLQHQSVVPGKEGVRALLEAVSASGDGAFLSVLKTFGALSSPGMLSFPRPGWTLALDFAFRGPTTLALLERLDAIVREHGGAVYPAKDARMSAETFRASFPRWEAFSRHLDPRFRSRFWERVTR